MSDAPTAPAEVFAIMQAELREMELAHVELAGRIVQQRANMALVEQTMPRRPGRPRIVRTDPPEEAACCLTFPRAD
jgi:hypothetical protein